MTRHVGLLVLIPAVTPVIVVAMIIVRQERLKTTPVLMLLQPNAVPVATDVRIARPAVRLTPVLMSVLPNAAAAIPVPTPAGQGKSLCPALLRKTK